MVRNILITGLFLGLSLLTFAQATYGTLEGVVTDDASGEGLIAASITVLKPKSYTPVTGTSTGIEGDYSIPDLEPGIYDIDVTYVGYFSKTIKNVTIEEGKVFKLDVSLEEGKGIMDYPVVYSLCIPIISFDQMETGRIFTKDDIRNSPIKW